MRKHLLSGLSAAVLATAALGLATSVSAAKAKQAAGAAPVGSVMTASRRLTESEYRHTIADLFGPAITINGRFEPEQRSSGLLAIGSSKLSITSGGFEQYYAIGRSISDQVLSDKTREKFEVCKPASATAPDDACVAAFVKDYGRKLFRRPLTDAEVAQRVTLANQGSVASKNYYTGLKLALTSLLTSPEFLFRLETAEPDPAHKKTLRLDGYTKASRLSYLLWDTGPDDELIKAAETGEIHTQAGLDRQVARLMASPKLETGMRSMFSDILQLELYDTVTKDAGAYPKYSQAVIDSGREQTLRTLVDLLLTKRGDYRDVFTTPDTFVDRTLAAVYRLPSLGAGAWKPYHYADSADQAGILTQVSFMALFSHPGRSSPTKRGVALNLIFLCEETPDPPPNVDFSLIQDTDNPLLKTVRSRLLAHATDESCAGCHNLVDPIGLSLERFDGIGQPRERENGELIDVTSQLDGVKFEGAKGLGKVLHDNPRAPACLVKRTFAYGSGRDPSSDWEAAYLDAQDKAFAKGGYIVPDMMKRIAASPEFYKAATPPAAKPEPKSTTKAKVAVKAAAPSPIPSKERS